MLLQEKPPKFFFFHQFRFNCLFSILFIGVTRRTEGKMENWMMWEKSFLSSVGCVDTESPAVELVAVEVPHGVLGRGWVLVLAETESLRSSGFTIVDNPERDDRAGLSENLLQLVLGDSIWNVTNEYWSHCDRFVDLGNVISWETKLVDVGNSYDLFFYDFRLNIFIRENSPRLLGSCSPISI